MSLESYAQIKPHLFKYDLKVEILSEMYLLLGGMKEIQYSGDHFQRMYDLGKTWILDGPTHANYPVIEIQKRSHNGETDSPLEGKYQT